MRLDRGGVALAVAALLSFSGCTTESPDGQTDPPPELEPTEIPQPVLDSLADGATSGEAMRVADAMEVPPGQALDEQFVKQMGALTVEFQRGTAVSLGERQVRINAEVTDDSGAVTEWYVVLDKVGGDYRIATTEEKP